MTRYFEQAMSTQPFTVERIALRRDVPTRRFVWITRIVRTSVIGLSVVCCGSAIFAASNQSQAEPTARQQHAASSSSSRPDPHDPREAGQSPFEDVKRITPSELKDLFSSATLEIVDVRRHEAWKADRIKGAKSIPLRELADRAGELNRESVIITYCGCPKDKSAVSAARELQKLGFRRVFVLQDGYGGARKAGLPMEKGDPSTASL